jgi:energy-coupling factor transporter ATP-binding protein EcfA2
MDEQQDVVLEASQEQALATLCEQLEQRIQRIEQVTSSGARGMKKPATGEPVISLDESNVFGVLGPRGSGKSTLLRNLSTQWMGSPGGEWASPARGHDRNRATSPRERAILLPPLDCSTLPPELPPGIAVLLYVRDRWLRDGKSDNDTTNHLAADFEKLLHDYSSMYREYRELTLELSATFEDFGHYMSDGVAKRLRLGENLEGWLAQAMAEAGKTALIVPLDDFDLIRGSDVRQWLGALLDELRRVRLMFVITADFQRLERLSPDHEQQFDDKTGRALVHKLLPPRHRISLPPWRAARDFGRVLQEGAAPVSLGSLLDAEASRLAIPARWLHQLVPERARGIVNLWDALAAARQRPPGDGGEERMPAAQDSRSSGKVESPRELFALLAECRDAPTLVRRIRSLDPVDWLRDMAWKGVDLAVDDWEESVETAQQRAAESRQGMAKPFTGLVDDEDDGGKSDGGTGSSPGKPRPATRSTRPMRSDGGEPSGQEQQRRRYLRDVDGPVRQLWAETLAEWCMAGNMRARARFLELWGPARTRLGRARMRVDLDVGRMRHYFDEQADRADSGFDAILFSWLAWPRKTESPPGAEWLTLDIGWQPLLEALRGKRDGWPTELVEAVALDPRGLAVGEVPQAGSSAALALLPAEIWAHVLLVDALDRCPWGPLRRTRGWELWTYLALAAVLVRTAYMFSLRRIGILEQRSFDGAQRLFLDVLERRNPVPLLRLQEHEVEDRMVEIFAHDGASAGVAARIRAEAQEGRDARGHALVAAADAYLASPAYTRLAACRPVGSGTER